MDPRRAANDSRPPPPLAERCVCVLVSQARLKVGVGLMQEFVKKGVGGKKK